MCILRIIPLFYVYVNQGFHVSMDSLDGFSGLASKTLEYLQDEYANKNIFAMPVMSENYITGDENVEMHAVNTSLLFSSLFEHANIFVPLTTSFGGWAKSHNHLNLDHLSYKVYWEYRTQDLIFFFFLRESRDFSVKQFLVINVAYKGRIIKRFVLSTFIMKYYNYNVLIKIKHKYL